MIMSGVKERDEGGQGTTVSIFGGPTAPLGSLQHALARSWFGLSRVFLLISLAFFFTSCNFSLYPPMHSTTNDEKSIKQ